MPCFLTPVLPRRSCCHDPVSGRHVLCWALSLQGGTVIRRPCPRGPGSSCCMRCRGCPGSSCARVLPLADVRVRANPQSMQARPTPLGWRLRAIPSTGRALRLNRQRRRPHLCTRSSSSVKMQVASILRAPNSTSCGNVSQIHAILICNSSWIIQSPILCRACVCFLVMHIAYIKCAVSRATYLYSYTICNGPIAER